MPPLLPSRAWLPLSLAVVMGLGATSVSRPTAALRQGASPAAQAADSVTGTVRYAEPDAGTLTVITGTSLALRTVRFDVAAEARTALSTLRPGAVVRVRYRETEAGLVAESVEVLRAAPEAGG